jgi:hypothetical protein
MNDVTITTKPVLLEKLTPFGRWVARAAGVARVVAGAWVMLSSPL